MSKNTLLSDNKMTKSKLSPKTLAKTGLSILALMIATTASAETYQVVYHIVEKGDSLSSLAKAFKTSSSEIKSLNPSIKANTLKAGDRLVIPRKKVRHSVTKTSKAKHKTKIKTNITTKKYRVQFGDTLSGIAKKNHTSLNTLLKINGIKTSHKLLAGKFLRVPTAKTAKVSKAKVTSVKVSTRKPAVKSKKLKPSPLIQTKSGQLIYKVQSGDSLLGIAKVMDTSVVKLQKLNNIDDINSLRVGQKIIVRGKTKAIDTVVSTPAPVKKAKKEVVVKKAVEPKKVSFSAKAPTKPKYITYTVQNGDTLAGVAKYFGVKKEDLVKFNKLGKSEYIKVGSTIIIAEKK